MNPDLASPKVLLLGVFGGFLQLFGATLLVGSVLYRVRLAPLTERQAHAALNAEDFARYVGLGTGGLAIVLSLCLFAVGLGGGDAVSAYIAFTGRNPSAASGFGVAAFSTSSIPACSTRGSRSSSFTLRCHRRSEWRAT